MGGVYCSGIMIGMYDSIDCASSSFVSEPLSLKLRFSHDQSWNYIIFLNCLKQQFLKFKSLQHIFNQCNTANQEVTVETVCSLTVMTYAFWAG